IGCRDPSIPHEHGGLLLSTPLLAPLSHETHLLALALVRRFHRSVLWYAGGHRQGKRRGARAMGKAYHRNERFSARPGSQGSRPTTLPAWPRTQREQQRDRGYGATDRQRVPA